MPRLDDYLAPTSRLMADPFASRPRRITPEEQSTLDYLGETSLGGLAYLGKLADKTFGGRAIRGGVLGGNPRELLSILPLSDTLGLTDESDTVYGKKLLEDAGVISRDPTPGFGWNDVAGIAADIALDPATYLGFGALTKAGTLAAKAGATLPRTTAGRIGGFAARESELAAEAARLGTNLPSVAKTFGIAGEPLIPTALEHEAARLNIPLNPRYRVRSGPVSGLEEQAATPLAGALGFGLPFGEKTPLFTGAVGQFLARNNPIALAATPFKAADRMLDQATGFSPGRALGALFDPEVKGLSSQPGQSLAREFTSPLEREIERSARYDFAGPYQEFTKVAGAEPARAASALDYLRSSIEGAQTWRPPMLPRPAVIDPAVAATAAGHFTPVELAEIERIGGVLKRSADADYAKSAALGISAPELDAPVEHFFRSQQVLPKQPGESVFDFVTRQGQQYSAKHQSQIRREPILTQDIPHGTTQVNRWSTDPALSGPSRTLTPLQAQNQIAQEILQGAPMIRSQADIMSQAGKIADLLHRLPDTHAQQAVPYFSRDVFNDFLKYRSHVGEARAAGETSYEAIGRFAEPIVPGSARSTDIVPLDKVLKEMGLVGKDAAGQPIAPLLAAERLGLNPNALSTHGLDKSLYRDMQRINQAWRNPGDIVPALAAWDAMSNVFKTWMTIPFVAYHARNLAQSIFAMWRGGDGLMGALSPKAMGQTMDFIRGQGLSQKRPWLTGSNPEEWTKQFTSELIGEGVTLTPRNSNAADILGQAGEQIQKRPNLPVDSGKGLIGDVGAWAGGMKPTSPLSVIDPRSLLGIRGVAGSNTNVLIRQMEQAGQTIDEWGRASHYYALRDLGYAPKAAADEVAKLHLDYSRLSNVEKQVGRRLFPWYAFQRQNLPPLLEEAASNPAKLSATLRATTEGRDREGFTPQYVAEGAAIPIPGAEDGSQRYISSFGLSTEDEAVKALAELAHGNLTRAGQVALGSTMPQVKIPLETLFGTQLYSGRRLSDLKPYGLLKDAGVPEDTGRQITQVVSSLPVSRAASTVDKTFDARKDWLSRLLNIGTGVRITDVDVETQKPYAQKRLLEQLLAGQPGVRQSDSVYLSKKAQDEGRVSPAERQLYDLYLKIESQIRRQGR